MAEMIGEVVSDQLVIDEDQARLELTRAVGLAGGVVVEYSALNRRDFMPDGTRRPGGALVIDCGVAMDDGTVRRERVEIDDNRRPMSEEAIRYLGSRAPNPDDGGDYIYRTI